MIQYPKYKATGIDWIKKIPEEWEFRKLKFLVKGNLLYGANESAIFDDPDFPRYIRITDFDDSGGLLADTFKSLPPEKAEPYLLHEGDILFARSGATVGKTFQVKNFKDKACFAGYLIKATPDKKISFTDYLYFYTKSLAYEEWKNYIFIKNTIENIGANKYKELFIPLPPLPEQKAIADYLDKKTETINKLIDKQKKLIELLNEKRSAIITEAVTKGLNSKVKYKPSGVDWIGDIPEGWEVRKLKWVAKVKTSNVNKKIEENEIPVRLCNYVDVYKNEFIDNSIDFMEASASIEEIAKFSIKSGDVIITKDSEDWNDIAIPAYIKENFNDVLCGYHLSMFRPVKDAIDGQFLFRAMQSKSVNHQFKVSANGITRFGLSTYSIASSILPVPPLKEQILIVEHIDKKTKTIDKLIEKAIQVIEKLGEYKQSIITEAVTGKFCVFSDLTPESNITEIVEENQKKENKAFKRNVLAAEIIHQLYTEPTFGHVKFEKIMFLCEKSTGYNFSDYQRAAAGPYDNKAIRGIDSQLKKLRWFEAKKEGGRFIYKPLEKAGEHQQYFNRYYINGKVKIAFIIDLLRTFDTERCEIVATLYSAWLDFLQDNKTPSDKTIVDEVLNNWHDAKKRIQRDRWEKALMWMKENNLVPNL
jgi:type I restriction enzyme S subunit